jgi:hypothetical protein
MSRSIALAVIALFLIIGVLALSYGLVLTPVYAEKHLYSGDQLTPDALESLRDRQVSVLVLGGYLTLIGVAVLTASMALSVHPQVVLVKALNSKHVVLCAGISLWAVLYIVYLLRHTIPSNPGGFYLESSRQLARNGFLIPRYVEGFGKSGIPFAFPPLAFYVLGGVGALVGGEYIAALYIPGLLLPIQALAAYFFMRRWRKSETAAQWTAVVLMLVPHIFYRTLWGDGITTGLSGVFLLLSWGFAVTDSKIHFYRRCAIGGILVGLSILSHPGIGLFGAVSFSVLCLFGTRFTAERVFALAMSGAAAFVVMTPWLLTVLSMHGVGPFIAAVQDSKSSMPGLGNLREMLDYAFEEHEDGGYAVAALILVPFAVAVFYTLVRGPRVVILLLVAGALTFNGHPSVTMFVFSVATAIFFANVLVPAFSKFSVGERALPAIDAQQEIDWGVLVLSGVYLVGLAWLCYPYVVGGRLSNAWQETIAWARTNTDPASTFIVEPEAENLVYFGERTLLLPVLGAEWIPTEGFANGLERNQRAKEEIFDCRDVKCLNDAFDKYSVLPDYLVFKVSSDDAEEKEWVTSLVLTLHAYDVGLISSPLVTLRRLESPGE